MKPKLENGQPLNVQVVFGKNGEIGITMETELSDYIAGALLTRDQGMDLAVEILIGIGKQIQQSTGDANAPKAVLRDAMLRAQARHPTETQQ